MTDKPKYGKNPVSEVIRSDGIRFAVKLMKTSSGEKMAYLCTEKLFNGEWRPYRSKTICPKCKEEHWAGSKGTTARIKEFDCIRDGLILIESGKVDIEDDQESDFP